MASTTTGNLTAEMLADLEVPHELNLSPSGTHIIYTLRTDWSRPKGRWVSSLWLADVNKAHSAQQVTTGDSWDSWPQWSPDGKTIAFLSDSAQEGVTAIYTLDVDADTNSSEISITKKPIPLTDTKNAMPIGKFTWSPDGRSIAYLSADEKTPERKAKEDAKDDAKVYGEHWDYTRLRVVDVVSKSKTTLVSTTRDVYEFTWSPDSQSIAYATQETPEAEVHLETGSSVDIIQLNNDRTMVSSSKKIVDIPGGQVQDLRWVKDTLWWRGRYTINKNKSSLTIYTLSLLSDSAQQGEFKYKRFGTYGELNCAKTWAFPPGLIQITDDKLVVQIQSGLSDQLHILPKGTKIFDEVQEVRSWDVKVVDNDKTVVAVVTSTAATPFEVYSYTIVDGSPPTAKICLSTHGAEITALNLPITSSCFYAKASDGTDLDAVFVTPTKPPSSSTSTSTQPVTPPKPWPTIVLVHGGPYNRVSPAFDQPSGNWSAYLASTNPHHALLLPNYRGGSSRGETFAAGVRGTAGTLDYSDTIDIIHAGIDAGIIDADRVAIGGWSYGGYISYLAVSRASQSSKFQFRAALCGAGLSDWDHTIMTSSGWISAIEIAGSSPWTGGVGDTHNREGSALWSMAEATKTTPVLILHGENDDIVPVSQALGFHHGCRHYGIPCEMVIYPREGHGGAPPFERAHYVDVLVRMRRFFDRYLGTD